MIEFVDDLGLDDEREIVEIEDHASRGTLGLQRAGNGDFETVRVAVQPRALSRMMREHVRRFKPECFTDLHESVYSLAEVQVLRSSSGYAIGR